jgi:hypothetical protein
MSKKELTPEERKIKLSITIDPLLFNKMDKLVNNKSKYIENLLRLDLIKNNRVDKDN